MKVTVVGRNTSDIEPLLEQYGFEVVGENPEFVVSYGGDGTLMKSEEFYPGIPKIILKDSMICKKCSPFTNEVVLQKIKNKEYVIESMTKLIATINDKEFHGLNDIIVHNKDPRRAMRYHVEINGKRTHHEVIGDGIVVATPFGATGYYRSITHSYFDTGIGLAFNNSIEPSDHIVLREGSQILLEVTRGPAIVYADNHETILEIEAGARVIIAESPHKAQIVVPK